MQWAYVRLGDMSPGIAHLKYMSNQTVTQLMVAVGEIIYVWLITSSDQDTTLIRLDFISCFFLGL